MLTSICPAGQPRPEVSANEGIYLKHNQIPYNEYIVSRPLTDDLALNTQIIQQSGGVYYSHYDNHSVNKYAGFGTSGSIDHHMRQNNETFGYKPSTLVENAMDRNQSYISPASKTSLKEFSTQLKTNNYFPNNHLTTEGRLEARRSGVVGMIKFSDGKSNIKTNNVLPGVGFVKTSAKTNSRDEQQILNQFRENRKIVGNRIKTEDIESVDSISFEEI